MRELVAARKGLKVWSWGREGVWFYTPDQLAGGVGSRLYGIITGEIQFTWKNIRNQDYNSSERA